MNSFKNLLLGPFLNESNGSFLKENFLVLKSWKFQVIQIIHSKHLWEFLLFIKNSTVNSKQRHINFIRLIAAITGLFRGLTTRESAVIFRKFHPPSPPQASTGSIFIFRSIEKWKSWNSFYLFANIFSPHSYREKTPLKIHADVFDLELDAEFFQFLQFRDDGRQVHVARAVFLIVVFFVDFFYVRNRG